MDSDIEEIFIGSDDDIEVIDVDAPRGIQTDKVMPTSSKDASKQENLKTSYDRSEVVNYILKRQKGQSKGDINLSLLKPLQLDPKKYFPTTHNELHISDCDYIRPGLDGKSVVGLWHGDQYDAILYRIQLELNSLCTSEKDAAPKSIVDIQRQGPFFAQTDIGDVSDTYIRGDNGLLYVGKKLGNITSSSVICNFQITPPKSDRLYISHNDHTCCAGCEYDNLFVIGTTEGILIYKDYNCTSTEEYTKEINVVEFNGCGNMIYCGVDSAQLLAYDLRGGNSTGYELSIEGLSNAGITDTKVLSNEKEVIVSCKDGTMGKLDLRTKGISANYAGHVALRKRIPFTVSESADLVCATGSDNLTRIWSLSTGELLHSIKPHMSGVKTHSALVSSGLRWAVGIFQKNRMYVVEPCA